MYSYNDRLNVEMNIRTILQALSLLLCKVEMWKLSVLRLKYKSVALLFEIVESFNVESMSLWKLSVLRLKYKSVALLFEIVECFNVELMSLWKLSVLMLKYKSVALFECSPNAEAF